MRAIEGPVRSTTTKPCTPGGTVSPASSTTRVEIPGTARVAQPGLSAVRGAPSSNVPGGANWGSCGRGDITVAPVSDCHHVSTNGTSSLPSCARSQRQASGLIDSPTEPSSRIELRL